jgi:ankyrin repeat protein
VKVSIKLLDFLIAHSANINLQDQKGETVLHKAALQGSSDLVVHLLSYPQSSDLNLLSNQRISVDYTLVITVVVVV